MDDQQMAYLGLCLTCAQAHIYPYEGYARTEYGVTCLCDHVTDATVRECGSYMAQKEAFVILDYRIFSPDEYMGYQALLARRRGREWAARRYDEATALMRALTADITVDA